MYGRIVVELGNLLEELGFGNVFWEVLKLAVDVGLEGGSVENLAGRVQALRTSSAAFNFIRT